MLIRRDDKMILTIEEMKKTKGGPLACTLCKSGCTPGPWGCKPAADDPIVCPLKNKE